MTPHVKLAMAGIVLGLILFIFAPAWVALGVIALAIAAPTVAWFALAPSQRRRIRGMRKRGQLPF